MMNIIRIVSRSEALKKGDLVDVTFVAKELGFKQNFDFTNSVWEEIIESVQDNRISEKSKELRIQNILQMFDYEYKRTKDNTILFPLIYSKNGKASIVTLKAVIIPIYREKNSVITIMQKDEFIRNEDTGLLKGRIRRETILA